MLPLLKRQFLRRCQIGDVVIRQKRRSNNPKNEPQHPVFCNAESVRINGYYVRPLADNNNIYTLPTQQPDTYYMLTDLLNGCQFIAYGQDRQHLTVEHNNFISNPNNYNGTLCLWLQPANYYGEPGLMGLFSVSEA